MNNIFQIPGCITKVTSMSKNTVRIQVDSQENTSPEAMKRMFELINQLGWFTFNVHQIEAQDILNLPPLRPMDAKKSPSERLRSVFFRCWEQDNKGHKEFDNYYIARMESLIEHFKKELV